MMEFIDGQVNGLGSTELDTAWASWIMVLLYFRFVLLFLINIILIVIVIVDCNIKKEPETESDVSIAFLFILLDCRVLIATKENNSSLYRKYSLKVVSTYILTFFF